MENVLSSDAEESLNEFLDLDQDADDFKIIISSFLFTYTSPAKFSKKIRSVVFALSC